MSTNDLYEIKQRVFEEERIYDLLDKLECQHIQKRYDRYEAQLPSKFNSNNRRAVQITNNKHLYSEIWNLSFAGKDIFDLVSFIYFNKETKEEFISNLYESKKWICEQLGYIEYLGFYKPSFKKKDPLDWLKGIKRQRRSIENVKKNEVLNEKVLNQYIDFPSYEYLQQGLDYKTQILYGIKFDISSKRIVFPIHNQQNELIGVKGRTVLDTKDDKYSHVPKFLYLYNFNKGIELFNLDKALPHILEKKEVIVFEAEKSCMLAYEYGFYNTVAIGGFELTPYQVELLSNLGIEVKIVLAYDKDKDVNAVLSQANKFNKSRRLYVIYDYNDLLGEKDSPVDRGRETFEQLYRDYLSNIDNQYRIIL